MLTNKQLYGTENVPPVNKDDCNERIAMLEAHKKEIYQDRDKNYTLIKVMEAIAFWKRMRDGEPEYI